MTKRDEAMQMLDQLETLLKRTEDTPDRMPTNRAFLIVARVVFWLLERWIREHEGYCLECRMWQEENDDKRRNGI